MLPNSTFYLDYRCPQSVLDNEQANVPVNNFIIADKVLVVDDDIRQQIAFKLWSYFEQEGLLEGDTVEDKTERFRELLDDQNYRSFVSVVKKHTFYNELARATGTKIKSLDRRIYDSAMIAANIVTNKGQREFQDEEKKLAIRLVSLDMLLTDDVDNFDDLLIDPDWDTAFAEAEQDITPQDEAKLRLTELVTSGSDAVREAVQLMRELQDRKAKGLPTSSDAIKSKLKRLRVETGLALKVAYLNE